MATISNLSIAILTDRKRMLRLTIVNQWVGIEVKSKWNWDNEKIIFQGYSLHKLAVLQFYSLSIYNLVVALLSGDNFDANLLFAGNYFRLHFL